MVSVDSCAGQVLLDGIGELGSYGRGAGVVVRDSPAFRSRASPRVNADRRGSCFGPSVALPADIRQRLG
jgi:hypothetical protein